MAPVPYDPLLAALNGEDSSMPPFVDAPGLAAPLRVDELTVPGPTKLSPVAAADAVHATKVGGKGYKVRVRGEYYAPVAEGKGKTKKPYEASFNVIQLDGCLSIIKNKLLKPALRAKYQDFISDRTCYVVDATPLSPVTPKSNNLAYMDRAQLEEYVLSASPKIQIDLTTYPASADGTTQLREAIIDYVQNPEGFAEREARRQTDRLVDQDLAALNPDLDLAAGR